jgi:hypothetical protein
MVDAGDLKSPDRMIVRVRIPAPAPTSVVGVVCLPLNLTTPLPAIKLPYLSTDRQVSKSDRPWWKCEELRIGDGKTP